MENMAWEIGWLEKDNHCRESWIFVDASKISNIIATSVEKIIESKPPFVSIKKRNTAISKLDLQATVFALWIRKYLGKEIESTIFWGWNDESMFLFKSHETRSYRGHRKERFPLSNNLSQ